MMAGPGPEAGLAPRRARELLPASLPRRGELIATCAVAIVAGHLLVAQLTLVLSVAFVAVGKVSRWRTWWLVAPAAVGVAWTLVMGPGNALAGFSAAPASVLAHLGVGRAPGRIGHPIGAFPGIGGLLPRQFPIALPIAAAEAALFRWLAWLHTDEWAVPPPRPGVVAALRAAVTSRAIRAGAVVTRDGCALGIAEGTGAVAELRWPELAGGALVTGADEREVTLAGLQVVHAALRRRKPVIVLADERDAAIVRTLAAACQATGAPLRVGGGDSAHGADPTPVAQGTSASQLWGRGGGRVGQDEGDSFQIDQPRFDLGQVVRERMAVLLPAGSPVLAARACADLASLAADLRRIGVDGDALVWLPRGELLPAQSVATLLRDGAAAGLPVLICTTSTSAASELGGLVGALLIHRVADPGLAAALATRTGTRLLPSAPVAASLTSQVAVPVAPPVGTPVAAPLASGGTADLVPCPVIPARSLLALGHGEFVLAMSAPRRRHIAPGRIVPARLPRPAARPDTVASPGTAASPETAARPRPSPRPPEAPWNPCAREAP